MHDIAQLWGMCIIGKEEEITLLLTLYGPTTVRLTLTGKTMTWVWKREHGYGVSTGFTLKIENSQGYVE